MENTKRFTNRSDNYVKYRPDYPPEIIELLQKEIHLDEFKDVADVGSGTGMFSRLFAKNGNITFGVEPNDEMRLKAEKSLGKYLNFISINGTAEFTNLADSSVDIVTAADAIHWFDMFKAKSEFSRILRDDGYCVIVYHITKNNTPFMKEFNKLIKLLKKAEKSDDEKFEKSVEKFFGPKKAKVKTLNSTHEMSFAELKGLVLSYAIMPEDGELHKKTLKELKNIFDRNNLSGSVSMEYKIKILIGKIK